jgi:hypothetical protein
MQSNGYIAIHIKTIERGCVYFIMAILRVYKRNSISMEFVNINDYGIIGDCNIVNDDPSCSFS